MLTRSDILAATSRHFRDVVVPADFPIKSIAGKTFRCWSMTASQQASQQSSLIDMETGKARVDRVSEIKARKFIATVGDDEGLPLFTEDDIQSVMNLPASLVDKVAAVADELNSFGNQSSAEDIAKN